MDEETLRKMAMEQALQGKTPVSIYREMGRSKKWFFKWLQRYKSGDTEWYRDHPRIPHSHPYQTCPDTRNLLIRIRRQLEEHPYAQIGTSAIKWECQKLGLTPPSDSTISRIIRREGLVKKNSLHPQGGGISIFARSAGHQQYPPSRSSRRPLYQERRPFLFASYYRSLQPPGLYSPPATKRRRVGGQGFAALLENDGHPRFSPSRQPTLFPGKQSVPALLRHRPSTLFIPGDRSGFHPHRRTLAQWND
jgi:transposase-like protein